jgi:CheY-like chemotaxis protein
MKVLKLTLTSAGFDVVTAASGDEAFGVFRQGGQFDLVLTDIVMPGSLQGPSLATEIRKLRPDTRFIFLSGYASDSGGSADSVSDHDIRLMKPVSRADLINAVETRLATVASRA